MPSQSKLHVLFLEHFSHGFPKSAVSSKKDCSLNSFKCITMQSIASIFIGMSCCSVIFIPPFNPPDQKTPTLRRVLLYNVMYRFCGSIHSFSQRLGKLVHNAVNIHVRIDGRGVFEVHSNLGCSVSVNSLTLCHVTHVF